MTKARKSRKKKKKVPSPVPIDDGADGEETFSEIGDGDGDVEMVSTPDEAPTEESMEDLLFGGKVARKKGDGTTFKKRKGIPVERRYMFRARRDTRAAKPKLWIRAEEITHNDQLDARRKGMFNRVKNIRRNLESTNRPVNREFVNGYGARRPTYGEPRQVAPVPIPHIYDIGIDNQDAKDNSFSEESLHLLTTLQRFALQIGGVSVQKAITEEMLGRFEGLAEVHERARSDEVKAHLDAAMRTMGEDYERGTIVSDK